MNDMFINQVKKIICVVLPFLLVSCASLPDSISSADFSYQSRFEVLQAGNENDLDKVFVFGGKIVSLANNSDGSEITILQVPLNSFGRPDDDTRLSKGRFTARFSGLLDPEIFKAGELISIRGRYKGLKDGFIGEHPYQYVTFDADGLHIWSPKVEPEFHYVIGIGTGFSRYRF